jgi:hypothetical protein
VKISPALSPDRGGEGKGEGAAYAGMISGIERRSRFSRSFPLVKRDWGDLKFENLKFGFFGN